MYTHADIIGAYYQVYNTLGYGFLEKVYQKAMEVELAARGVSFTPQAPLTVFYSGVVVGEYFADLFVEGCVIVELKAGEALVEENHAQLLNYLKATDAPVGLLLNFDPKPNIRRKVYETARFRRTPS